MLNIIQNIICSVKVLNGTVCVLSFIWAPEDEACYIVTFSFRLLWLSATILQPLMKKSNTSIQNVLVLIFVLCGNCYITAIRCLNKSQWHTANIRSSDVTYSQYSTYLIAYLWKSIDKKTIVDICFGSRIDLIWPKVRACNNAVCPVWLAL